MLFEDSVCVWRRGGALHLSFFTYKAKDFRFYYTNSDATENALVGDITQAAGIA